MERRAAKVPRNTCQGRMASSSRRSSALGMGSRFTPSWGSLSLSKWSQWEGAAQEPQGEGWVEGGGDSECSDLVTMRGGAGAQPMAPDTSRAVGKASSSVSESR